ncbi:hypothetical protein [Polaribacter sp. L3A8]|uniref:hypothetical protein n=1 Tax=Polaribacter sp. L3A8 TaxID=2686361 RepID=UPI00131C4F82|nr:hypothetical protein [Polaribacter sp. L3A8]
MGIVGSLFYVNELINHPQFNITTPYYINFITDIKQDVWYYIFFLIDFIWAPILLYFLYRILDLKIKNNKRLKIIYYFFIITYCSDFIENWLYLLMKFDALKFIKPVKEGLYALSFLLFFIVMIKKYKSVLIKLIIDARISLVFIIIVSFLIGFVDQGGDILITLYESKYNLVLTLLLLSVVAIPTAHYPIYFKNSKYMNSNHYEFVLSKTIRFLSFGIIYFTKVDNPGQLDKRTENKSKDDIFLMQFLRRCLGVLFFLSFFFMSLKAIDKVYNLNLTVPITFFIAILLFWFTWYFSSLKDIVDASFKESESALKEFIKEEKRFVFIIKMLPFILVLIALFILYFLINEAEWSKTYVFLALITNFLLAILYIVSVVGRSYLKYVFYSEKWTKMFLEANTTSYIDPILQRQIKPFKPKVFSLLSLFSNNIVYLRIISIIGALCVLSLVFLTIFWNKIHLVNPIPIFLMYYMAYYGMLVIYIKHKKYYLQEEEQVIPSNFDKIKKYQELWKYYIPGALTILTVIGVFSIFTGNDLHELQTIKRTGKETSISNFKDTIKGKDKHYFVASFGGGLKSNLWTMLLLDKLECRKNDFFENARCISTVSGGTVGAANFAFMKANKIENRTEKIEELGRLNSLSLDIVFLLGADWLRELIPSVITKFKGKDRSFYGMKQHLLVFNDSLQEQSETFYRSYNKIIDPFPPLIINSTSLNGRYANSLSLVLDKEMNDNYDTIFPGAINILGSKKGEELSLYRVASTSNRFPVLSPTAQIQKKGHFLDGGIFENSGLLSAHSFARFLESEKVIKKNDATKNIKFVNFINSKENYILEFIRKNKKTIFLDAIDPTAEYAGILNVLSATGHNPAYIKETIKREYELISIFLPHCFNFKDLKKILGGFPDYKEGKLDKILNLIKENNDTITSILSSKSKTEYDLDKWGVVQPATGRLLSEASVKYQIMMVNYHPDVREELNKFKN